MNNFVQYIAGLAETGETALVVLQKQTATGFVWLPQLPSAKMQDGKAWYMNTGSFMLDRMPKKLSASKSNAEYVLCMMLDDIGTKSKAPTSTAYMDNRNIKREFSVRIYVFRTADKG